MPKPAATVTLVQNMDCDEAIETMNRLAGHHSALSGACWLENKLNIRFSGTASAVKQASLKCNGDVMESGNDFWQQLRDMKLRFFDHANTLWRFSVKSSAGIFRPDARWLIDWGGALRWLCIAADERDVDRNSLEQAAVAANGQAMLFRGGDRSQEVFHSQSKTAMCIHRRLKSAFDPDGLLNPGRLYSWM
jgi:glycolate oxidase FAD binding subunit